MDARSSSFKLVLSRKVMCHTKEMSLEAETACPLEGILDKILVAWRLVTVCWVVVKTNVIPMTYKSCLELTSSMADQRDTNERDRDHGAASPAPTGGPVYRASKAASDPTIFRSPETSTTKLH